MTVCGVGNTVHLCCENGPPACIHACNFDIGVTRYWQQICSMKCAGDPPCLQLASLRAPSACSNVHVLLHDRSRAAQNVASLLRRTSWVGTRADELFNFQLIDRRRRCTTLVHMNDGPCIPNNDAARNACNPRDLTNDACLDVARFRRVSTLPHISSYIGGDVKCLLKADPGRALRRWVAFS